MKVDAIGFKVSNECYLKGYVHFPIIEWSDQEEITFKETVYEDGVVLFQDVFKFKRADAL